MGGRSRAKSPKGMIDNSILILHDSSVLISASKHVGQVAKFINLEDQTMTLRTHWEPIRELAGLSELEFIFIIFQESAAG
jgi:hypothetical protein